MNFYSNILKKEIIPRDSTTEIPGLPTAQRGIYRVVVKRLIDILLVLATSPVVLLTIIILAVLVARDGYNPIYQQRRVGKSGRVFTMWKLRTMVPRAEEMLESYLSTDPGARAEWNETQKLKVDPRITALGRFLRRSSLDELPQLFNVLKGDMSIVGPRPMMPEQQILYPGSCYYALRPGVTGLWQISARNKSTFADRAKFDTAYNHSLSLKTDTMVIWATVGVVLRGTGY